jgi:hypothetical protein
MYKYHKYCAPVWTGHVAGQPAYLFSAFFDAVEKDFSEISHKTIDKALDSVYIDN